MRRLLLSACAVRFLDSFVLIGPFYTVMFAERGLSPAQIGVVLAAWSLVGLAVEAPSGVLADRMSRPLLIAIAQLARCAGFLVWIFWPGFWGFLIGLMLWGLKSAALSGAFEAVVYDELKRLGRERDYARALGRTQSARFAGVMAAALGGAAGVGLGYDALMWASFAAGLAAAAAALALPQAPRATQVARRSYFGHLAHGVRQAASLPGVPTLLLFMAAMQAIAFAIADYWQLFALEVGLPKTGIGLFMAALSAVAVVVAPFAHRLSPPSLRGLALIYLSGGVCVIAAAATWRSWSIVFPMAYVALFWLVEINADARFHHALRSETRATVASLKGFATQCGASVLMLAFGLAAQVASYRAAFLGAGLLAVALGAGYALRRGAAASPP